MKGKPHITKVEVFQFGYEVKDVQLEPTIGIAMYKPGGTLPAQGSALRVYTDEGVNGEYVGGTSTEYAGLPMFVPSIIGRNALNREEIYTNARQALKLYAGMGLSIVDIALWDLAGKYYGAPIYELLGGSRRKLPSYASTHVGDYEKGGLDSPEAYADFAQQCLEMGYPGYKIHGWEKAPIERQTAVVHAVGKQVGGKMDLMIDPFHAIRTWGEALKMGWACDEQKFFWLEDPYKDMGLSAHGHRKLRQFIKTPLLQMETLRGLEPHVDFIAAEGSDFVRADPDMDGGITGTMKIAHAAEGFGLDVELHAPGPARRHLMAAIRNTNYYELGLVHPKIDVGGPPAYKDGYSDAFRNIDENGCVEVPDGPGLGVEYDWDYIMKNRTGGVVYD